MIFKKNLFISLISLFPFLNNAQEIEIGPLVQNPLLRMMPEVKSNSIDSSFIFSTDTISIPFFDNFTTNKIQEYTADFSNPLTTSEVYYLIQNQASGLPIPNDVFYTNQMTFHRYVDITNDTYSDTVFTPLNAEIADFSSYPVEYTPIDLYPPYYIYDTVGINDSPDTVWIDSPPYSQDSATQFFMPISDPNKLWKDNNAYHNYRFGVNPRTLGVMTFDGLDASGYPYAIGTSTSGYADYLTSKPIDLSGISISDSLYISFLYQPQGLGDVPEHSDSLILEFYSQSLNQWFHIWSDSGKVVMPFKLVHISIKNPIFFSDAFQFRFKNYGGLSGALDHFHLDMVSIKPAEFLDTVFSDFSIVYPINTLIKNYTSVPWDHYKSSSENKMTDSLQVLLYNGSASPENYLDGSVEVFKSGLLEGSFSLPGFILAEEQINYAPLSYANSYHDLTGSYEFDKTLNGSHQEFEVLTSATAQFDNYEPNDSIRFTQGFYNYYSYDDGSAEAAFGLTGVQTRLAVHFDSYEPDSIIGIDFSFVPSVNDVSDKLFLLTVWDDDNGVPGTVLYEDDVFSPRVPLYAQGRNNFIPYYFIDTAKIAVGTSFFIGWRQLDPDRLNLGYDRNINKSHEIYYSVDGGGSWLLSPFSGSAMLRPIFSTSMDVSLGIKNPDHEEQSVLIYPNPSEKNIIVKVPFSHKDSRKLLLDGFGRIIQETVLDSFDLSNLSPGLYFVNVPSYSSSFFKVIKR